METDLFENAYEAQQALKSDDHAEDLAALIRLEREIASARERVAAREEAAKAAMEAFCAHHCARVASGEAEPAPNTQAAHVFGVASDEDEFCTSRANGAHTED